MVRIKWTGYKCCGFHNHLPDFVSDTQVINYRDISIGSLFFADSRFYGFKGWKSSTEPQGTEFRRDHRFISFFSILCRHGRLWACERDCTSI